MKRNYIGLSFVTTAAIFTSHSLVFINVLKSQMVEDICGPTIV